MFKLPLDKLSYISEVNIVKETVFSYEWNPEYSGKDIIVHLVERELDEKLAGTNNALVRREISVDPFGSSAAPKPYIFSEQEIAAYLRWVAQHLNRFSAVHYVAQLNRKFYPFHITHSVTRNPQATASERAKLFLFEEIAHYDAPWTEQLSRALGCYASTYTHPPVFPNALTPRPATH